MKLIQMLNRNRINIIIIVIILILSIPSGYYINFYQQKLRDSHTYVFASQFNSTLIEINIEDQSIEHTDGKYYYDHTENIEFIDHYEEIDSLIQEKIELRKYQKELELKERKKQELKLKKQKEKNLEYKKNLEKYSEDDIELLARLIIAEGESLPRRGKILIAIAIKNRLKSKEFPDTIPDIIYQKTYDKGKVIPQFSCTIDGRINLDYTDESLEIAKGVLSGEINDNLQPLFFDSLSKGCSWASRNRPYLITVDNMNYWE